MGSRRMSSLKKREVGIVLSIISLLVSAYYIKNDVLRIDFLEHRHLLFWKN